jgi:hypothetical protein
MKFSETQYIRSPLVWILVGVVLISGGMGLYKAVQISMLVGLFLGMVCMIAIVTFLLLMPLSLKTVVDETEMRVTIYPMGFARFSIGLHQISTLQVVTTDYPKRKSDKTQVSNSLNFMVGSKFALRVVSTSGREVLVGTRRPGELFRALCNRTHGNIQQKTQLWNRINQD